jgi:hypothetical protein
VFGGFLVGIFQIFKIEIAWDEEVTILTVWLCQADATQHLPVAQIYGHGVSGEVGVRDEGGVKRALEHAKMW